jgi:hypothetical protein
MLHAPQERHVGEVYDNVPVETLQALKQLGLRGEVHLTASVVSEDLSMKQRSSRFECLYVRDVSSAIVGTLAPDVEHLCKSVNLVRDHGSLPAWRVKRRAPVSMRWPLQTTERRGSRIWIT